MTLRFSAKDTHCLCQTPARYASPCRFSCSDRLPLSRSCNHSSDAARAGRGHTFTPICKSVTSASCAPSQRKSMHIGVAAQLLLFRSAKQLRRAQRISEGQFFLSKTNTRLSIVPTFFPSAAHATASRITIATLALANFMPPGGQAVQRSLTKG